MERENNKAKKLKKVKKGKHSKEGEAVNDLAEEHKSQGGLGSNLDDSKSLASVNSGKTPPPLAKSGKSESSSDSSDVSVVSSEESFSEISFPEIVGQIPPAANPQVVQAPNKFYLREWNYGGLTKLEESRQQLRAHGFVSPLAWQINPQLIKTISVCHLGILMRRKPSKYNEYSTPLSEQAMVDWMNKHEAIFFKIMKAYLPKNNHSLDTVKALKACKLRLRAGDPTCVTEWSQRAWEIQIQANIDLTPEEWQPLMAHMKKDLITVKSQECLTERVVLDLASKIWPIGKPAPADMTSLIVRIMKHWDKFHADWIKFEKSGFHEQAQKNLTLEGGQDTDQADKDKASSKRKRREEASRKEQHKHPKPDTSVPTAKGGKCDGCGNKPDKQSKP